MVRTGLYPGTFDPVTKGHTDIIRRAALMVDRLVIGVAINRDKGPPAKLVRRSSSEVCGPSVISNMSTRWWA